MSKEIFYIEGSLYPHENNIAKNSATYDIQIWPLEEKYRELMSKSEKLIYIGQTEELPQGNLKCFLKKIHITEINNPSVHIKKKVDIKKEIAVVGVYKDEKVVGKELLYEPTQEEIKNGIPEWKFDAEHISTMGTAWDYQSTDLWIWTVSGLRKKGEIEFSKNLS